MALVTETLLGTEDKEAMSIEALRAFEPAENKKAKRITADYQREMEAAWNRWEDSDEEDPSHPFAESVMMGGQR